MIGVVDYAAGNAPSVMYALDALGLDARLVTDRDELMAVDHVILPGVGAARATLDSLSSSRLLEPLTQRVHEDGVPFLGICIGLQVLFEHSDEGDIDALGWVRGRVRRFPATDRVPQIGWNEVRITRPHPVTDGFPDGGHCYFVNSFYADPSDPSDIVGTTDYGPTFASIVARGNVVATQFHAEKSGRLGLGILERFAAWDGAPC